MATKKQRRSEQLIASYGLKPAGPKPGETLEQTHRRLAKQADQRLVRLEKLAEKEGYEGALTYSYGLATKNAAIYGSTSEKKRFNITPPKSKKQLQAKINDMIQFLNSPTSTKGGIDKMYKKRTQTLNEKYGTDFTWQEAGKFFESQKDAFKEKWESGLVLKAIGRLQKHADVIKEELQAFSKKHEVVSDDEVNAAIFKMIQKNGLEKSLFVNKKTSDEDIKKMFAKSRKKAPVKRKVKAKK